MEVQIGDRLVTDRYDYTITKVEDNNTIHIRGTNSTEVFDTSFRIKDFLEVGYKLVSGKISNWKEELQ